MLIVIFKRNLKLTANFKNSSYETFETTTNINKATLNYDDKAGFLNSKKMKSTLKASHGFTLNLVVEGFSWLNYQLMSSMTVEMIIILQTINIIKILDNSFSTRSLLGSK